MTKDIKISDLSTKIAASPPLSPIGSPIVPAQTSTLPDSMSAASELINKSHRRTANSIMETAYYCYLAQKRWKRKIKEFVHLLDFDEHQFSRYYKAYEREILRAHAADLPASLKTWSTLRKLSDRDLEKCFDEGKISPATTDKDARVLVREYVLPKERNTSNLRRLKAASIAPDSDVRNIDKERISITLTQDIAEKHPLSFRKWLDEGRQKFDIDIRNWPSDKMKENGN